MTTPRPGHLRILVCAAAVTAGLGSVTTAALMVTSSPTEFGQTPDAVRPAVTLVPVVPSTTATPTASAPSEPYPVGLADLVPERLVIDNIDVTAPVIPVSVAGDGALLVPTDPAIVGWWTGGAYPGAATGTVLVAGHVDHVSVGPGALYHLTSLQEGDRVRLDTAAGPHPYRVVARREYPKQRLPQDLFDRGGPPQLVLVTCGGAFTPGQGYADNIVVYAEPDTGSS